MIHVNDLSFGYRANKLILENISFLIEPGDCLAILGNNGAGKSTLLKCMNHILTPHSGSVMLNGENLLTMSNLETARRMSFVAQKSGISAMTVYDTVLLGRKPYMKFGATQKDYEIVEHVLKKLGLTAMADRYITEMSGGEQQKVMLARALAQEPKMMLLDEPTSNLDLHNQYEVMKIVSNVCLEQSIAAIVVIHDLNLALRYCNKFIFLKDKHIYAIGGNEILTEETISDVYEIPVKILEFNNQKIVMVE